MGTWSIWHWLVVLIVIVLIFGTKKLVDVGGDLGKAVKSFKDGLQGEDNKPLPSDKSDTPSKDAPKG